MLALKTIEVMKDHISVSEDAVCRGVRETRWQGRMETVLPGVIVDGAHNEDGVEKFVETAAHFQKEYPLTLLFSAVDDKDYTDMTDNSGQDQFLPCDRNTGGRVS